MRKYYKAVDASGESSAGAVLLFHLYRLPLAVDASGIDLRRMRHQRERIG
jgi:hypothetical protein